jgi:hypothetical protein
MGSGWAADGSAAPAGGTTSGSRGGLAFHSGPAAAAVVAGLPARKGTVMTVDDAEL